MNALITHCKKKGKGLHKKHLTDLSKNIFLSFVNRRK